jgi:glycogen(starch) synthase
VKILLCSQFYPPMIGGEERHTRNLAFGLRERGHEVVVATQGDTDSRQFQDGVEVVRIRPTTSGLPFAYQEKGRFQHPPVGDPAVKRGLKGLLQDDAFDVIHAHNWIVGSLVPLRHDTPAALVLTLHDYSHVCAIKRLMYKGITPCAGPAPRKCIACTSVHYKPGIGPAVYALTQVALRQKSRALDRILAVSNAVAAGNQLSRQPVPYDVVPNFIADDLGDGDVPRADWLPDGRYLVYVGDLSADKGVSVMLQAYASLPQPRPSLLLLGRPTISTPALDTFPDGVMLIGPREHDDVLSAMAHADAVLVPSIVADACPTVILEAMALGTAVIASATGGIVDMVTDGQEGRLVPPGEVQPLAEAIRTVLGDAVFRTAAGSAARQRAAEFRTGPVVHRVEQAYGLAIEHRLSRAR